MQTDLAKRVEKLIESIGKALTLRSFTKSGPDFDPTLTPSDSTVKGVVFDYNKDEIDGTIIQQRDKEIVISSNAATVSKQQKVVVDGVEYSIVELEVVGPGSSGNVMYVIQGRA